MRELRVEVFGKKCSKRPMERSDVSVAAFCLYRLLRSMSFTVFGNPPRNMKNSHDLQILFGFVVRDRLAQALQGVPLLNVVSGDSLAALPIS